MSRAETRFSRAAERYDSFSPVQQRVAEELARRLPTFGERPLRVLELGCGTGSLTARLVSHLAPGSTVIAVDFAAPMLAQAEARLAGSGVKFERCDMERLPVHIRDLDMIVSSSVLHWAQALPQLLTDLRSRIVPGGWLYAAMMLDGTLAALHRARARVAPDKPWNSELPALSHVCDLLKLSGFAVRESAVREEEERYSRFEQLVRGLRGAGVTGDRNGSRRCLLSRKELALLETAYDDRGECAGVFARYVVGFFSAQVITNDSSYEQ